MSELDDWIEEYRDGALSEENQQALSRALKNDPEARRRFVGQMGLTSILSERGIGVSAPASKIVPFVNTASNWEKKILSRGWWVAALVAAGVTLAVSIPERRSEVSPLNPVVAVITSAEDAIWKGGTPPDVGSALRTGSWELAEGRLEVVLNNGAELFLDGPLELEVESAFRTTLRFGNLSARIPPSALGFRVFTPKIEVIDLGTEFSVSVADNGHSAIRVHDGFVDARPLGGGEVMRLASSDTAKFGGMSETGQEPAFNTLRPVDGSFPLLSGDIRALHSPPSSLQAQAFEHDYLLLFEERRNVSLNESLHVDMVRAGVSPRSVRQLQRAGNALEPGVSIDSWMVHFDGVSQEDLVCEAEIAFPNDILAVIATTPTLASSDHVLGLEDRSYTDHNLRGVEFHAPQPERIDEIVISGDRKLLKLRWHVSTQVDQIRIITRSFQDKF